MKRKTGMDLPPPKGKVSKASQRDAARKIHSGHHSAPRQGITSKRKGAGARGA